PHRSGGNGRPPGRRPLQGDQGGRQVHQQIGTDARLGRQPQRRADREARASPARTVQLRRIVMKTFNRRLLHTACLGLMLGTATDAMAEFRQFEWTIEEVEVEVAPGFKAKVWGYNGQVPGPLLHVKEGDE